MCVFLPKMRSLLLNLNTYFETDPVFAMTIRSNDREERIMKILFREILSQDLI